MGFVLTGGEASDDTAVDDLVELPANDPGQMLGDKRYYDDEVRAPLLLEGILPVIPPKSNGTEPIACDCRPYKECNRIKGLFNNPAASRRDTIRPRCPS